MCLSYVSSLTEVLLGQMEINYDGRSISSKAASSNLFVHGVINSYYEHWTTKQIKIGFWKKYLTE